MSKSMLTRDLPSYRRQGGGKRLIRSLIALVFLGFLFATLVQGLFLRTYAIQSDAMQPALAPGDVVLSSPLLYGKELFFTGTSFLDFSRPQRGDVILLEPPYQRPMAFPERFANHVVALLSLGRWQPDYGRRDQQDWEGALILRRVIGLPGDQIYGNDGVFQVKPAGAESFTPEFSLSGRRYELRQPSHPIRDPAMVFSVEMPLLTVPEGCYFVAADNRDHSLDSRHWGVVKAEAIRGLAIMRYWPVSRFGWVH